MGYEARACERLESALEGILSKIGLGPEPPLIVGPLAALRRRSMVKQIDLAARQYDLRDEIDAFLAQAGCVSVAGLDDRRLYALSTWLGEVMDRYHVAADPPDAPVAR